MKTATVSKRGTHDRLQKRLEVLRGLKEDLVQLGTEDHVVEGMRETLELALNVKLELEEFERKTRWNLNARRVFA